MPDYKLNLFEIPDYERNKIAEFWDKIFGMTNMKKIHDACEQCNYVEVGKLLASYVFEPT